MHILLIGGLDRTAAQHQKVAEERGHTFRFHTGHLAHRGANSLEPLVRRADLVIVVTDTNSHAAVHVARRMSRQYGAIFILTRRFSPQRLIELIATHEAQAQATA